MPASAATRPDEFPGDAVASFGADRAARGLDAVAGAVADVDAGDFAILDDVDAAAVGAARIAPGHRVVPGGTATRCNSPPLIGKRALS
jgi:MoxR-like ATPase